MAKPGVFEVFEKTNEQKTIKERAAVLKSNQHPIIFQILKYTFDPRVEFALPEGVPPYQDNDPVNAETFLYTHQRKLQLFRKGSTGDNLTQTKRELLFIELLESIHPRDAKILLGMKDKKLPDEYNKITKKVVDTAFPGLLEQGI